MSLPRKEGQICQEARDKKDKWDRYWTINRSLYYDWVDFIMGDQWREDESKLFERYNKIPLMFNKLGVLLNHLLAEQIMNTPNLQIVPGSKVPAETAETRAALVKNIQFNSNSKVTRQKAFGQAIVGGFSAYRTYADYANDKGFDQDIFIEAFNDPNMCYWDIGAKSASKTDGMFSGFITRISRERFKDRWGKDIEGQIGSIAISEQSALSFADDDSISELNHYERVPRRTRIYQLSNGDVIDSVEFKSIEKIKMGRGKSKLLYRDGMILSVIQEREVVQYKIRHRQIAGDFLLAETEMPMTKLPIIFVDMKSYYTKAGQQVTRSFFKDARDAQKYLNYLKTQAAYMMKVSRYDQFMAPRKCVSAPDTQQQWRDPSVVRGALVYDETPSGAKPERLAPPELSRSLADEYDRTLMDIQSGTGMYNTQMGEIGNEVSGRAIDARTQRGTKNTYVPFDSINQAILAEGEIINEMIPFIYDTERELSLSMPHSESANVKINEPIDEYGGLRNNMTDGEYRIILKPGASYEGQKEVALESLQSIIMADKTGTVFQLIADLYAENLPLDNNLEIKNRLRTIVDPKVIEAGKTGQPLPPKEEQPNPEMVQLQLKQQDLQLKSQQSEREFAIDQANLEMKRAELQRKAIETHSQMIVDIEKMEAGKEEAAARLQETILRSMAEGNRVQADLQIAQGQNLIKLLLHKSKEKDKANVARST